MRRWGYFGCWFLTVTAKLVVDRSFLDNFDGEIAKTQGELVKTEYRRHTTCQGVEEKVETFRFYSIAEDGVEDEHQFELATVVDVNYNTEKIHNFHERWIWAYIYIRPYLNCFEQDDEFVISALRDDHLRPPSTEKYNFSSPDNTVNVFGQFGQPVYLDTVIFKGQVKNGFFIEAGADDFETDSNTLLFEMEHQWTGLLVEPNPTIYPKGFTKHRKAWGSSSCLATEPRPHVVPFSQKTVSGGMAGIVKERNDETYDMQCFPLYSLLMAIGNRTVNYFSLDIEGAEFAVLQTIPWDKVDIEVMTIETNHAGEIFPGTKQEIRDYLADKGYVYARTVEIDDVFIRKDLYEGKYKPDPEKEVEFEALMGESCDLKNDMVQLEEYIQYISVDKNFKIEL